MEKENFQIALPTNLYVLFLYVWHCFLYWINCLSEDREKNTC